MLEQDEFIRIMADTLRQDRRKKGYTLDKLAEKSNIDYSTVSLIENGKQNPRIYTFYKLLYALDIDIVRLVNDKSDEISDRKVAVLNKLSGFDTNLLENVYEFIKKIDTAKKF